MVEACTGKPVGRSLGHMNLRRVNAGLSPLEGQPGRVWLWVGDEVDIAARGW